MTKQSAIVEETKKLAHAKFDKPYVPAEAVQPGFPLVPIFISVSDGSGGEIGEHLLWKLGDPTFEPKAVAGRMCQDLSLPPAAEREIEDQINFSLKSYKGWRDLGGEKRVHMEVYVRHGTEVMRDEVEWDVNNPVNTAHSYAAQVCKELDLNLAWFDAINAYMQKRIDEYMLDFSTHNFDDELLPPVESIFRTKPLDTGLPRIEPYDASRDMEAQRLKARAQRLEQHRTAA